MKKARRENIFKITFLKVNFLKQKYYNSHKIRKKLHSQSHTPTKQKSPLHITAESSGRGNVLGKLQRLRVNQNPYFFNGLNSVLGLKDWNGSQQAREAISNRRQQSSINLSTQLASWRGDHGCGCS